MDRGIPVVSLTVDGMRHTVQKAFTQHLLDIDTDVQAALAEVTKPDHLRAVLAQEMANIVREEMRYWVRDYLKNEQGREQIKRFILKRLESMVLKPGFFTRIFDRVLQGEI